MSNFINLSKLGYIAVNRNTNSPIGIDHNSGGYPYDTFEIQSIRIWDKMTDVAAYIKHFPNLDIERIKIELVKY